MSNLDLAPTITRCGGLGSVSARPVHDLFEGKTVDLGDGTIVRRVLPNLGRRLVGAWCFVDHYGPDEIPTAPGMQVPPHPHIGLQTVSWLLDGTVRHRDSLGSDQLIRPRGLGLMTSGAAIAHAEQSPVPHPAMLHGVQLWVALPDGQRSVSPSWAYHDDLPVLTERGGSVTVIMGELAGARSPGRAYTPLVGADVTLDTGGRVHLPLDHTFEHAVLVTSGSLEVDGVALAPGALLYLGCARRELALSSVDGARVLLLGGVPFEEEIVMWWNFVARTNDEIVAARDEWITGGRFGDVAGYAGYRLPAPALPPGRLKPGGATR